MSHIRSIFCSPLLRIWALRAWSRTPWAQRQAGASWEGLWGLRAAALHGDWSSTPTLTCVRRWPETLRTSFHALPWTHSPEHPDQAPTPQWADTVRQAWRNNETAQLKGHQLLPWKSDGVDTMQPLPAGWARWLVCDEDHAAWQEPHLFQRAQRAGFGLIRLAADNTSLQRDILEQDLCAAHTHIWSVASWEQWVFPLTDLLEEALTNVLTQGDLDKHSAWGPALGMTTLQAGTLKKHVWQHMTHTLFQEGRLEELLIAVLVRGTDPTYGAG